MDEAVAGGWWWRLAADRWWVMEVVGGWWVIEVVGGFWRRQRNSQLQELKTIIAHIMFSERDIVVRSVILEIQEDTLHICRYCICVIFGTHNIHLYHITKECKC